MPYDPQVHHRRSIRLREYDYAQGGMYFVTICTSGRALFFADEAVKRVAERCWLAIPEHHQAVELAEWVVMPNHLHGLILLGQVGGRGKQGVQLNAPTAHTFPQASPKRNSLGVVVRTYKAAVTTACRRAGFEGFGWQRGYYDRVVRNDRELDRIREYIANNPYRWEMDEHYLATPGTQHRSSERRSPP